ncbi:DUF397 domain-containing protein [Streptomyces avicenniae]|uniref:DUF397 domain-containing protein n=1 Tax=Streptomyces avicenniae TaxID=500153 RepID=UPI00069C2CA1|nr:DUF397 domain-containing protein [Streptomyces avicenniae]
MAQVTGVNDVTLRRIEARQARPQGRTLIVLLDAYSVRGDKREEMIALAKGAQEQGWIRPFDSELPDEYNTCIQFESEASEPRYVTCSAVRRAEGKQVESSGVPEWRTSSFSSGSGECVEVGTNLCHTVPVRDSKRHDSPVVAVPVGSWEHFVSALGNRKIG